MEHCERRLPDQPPLWRREDQMKQQSQIFSFWDKKKKSSLVRTESGEVTCCSTSGSRFSMTRLTPLFLGPINEASDTISFFISIHVLLTIGNYCPATQLTLEFLEVLPNLWDLETFPTVDKEDEGLWVSRHALYPPYCKLSPHSPVLFPPCHGVAPAPLRSSIPLNWSGPLGWQPRFDWCFSVVFTSGWWCRVKNSQIVCAVVHIFFIQKWQHHFPSSLLMSQKNLRYPVEGQNQLAVNPCS